MKLYQVTGDPARRWHAFEGAIVVAADPEQAKQMVVDCYQDADGRPLHAHGPKLGDPATFVVEEISLVPGVLMTADLAE